MRYGVHLTHYQKIMVIAALDTTSTYQGNYKNRIVQSWQTFNPQEVRPENIYITEG